MGKDRLDRLQRSANMKPEAASQNMSFLSQSVKRKIEKDMVYPNSKTNAEMPAATFSLFLTLFLKCRIVGFIRIKYEDFIEI